MGFSAGLAVAAVVGVASAAASGAFNKVPSAPPPPPPPAPAPMPMPTMDSDAVLAAQKKQAQIAENEFRPRQHDPEHGQRHRRQAGVREPR